MTLPNLSRIDTQLLYPPFLARLCMMLEALNDAGAEFAATEGFRTMQRSAALYFQGRTTPGEIVTDAPPGLCSHNYGLATDFCRVFGEPGDKHAVSWEESDYDILGDEARRAGLVWGGDWKTIHDRPHVQWPGFVTGHELQPLKAIYDRRAVAGTDGLNTKAWLQEAWTLVSTMSDTQPEIHLPQPPKPEST